MPQGSLPRPDAVSDATRRPRARSVSADAAGFLLGTEQELDHGN